MAAAVEGRPEGSEIIPNSVEMPCQNLSMVWDPFSSKALLYIYMLRGRMKSCRAWIDAGALCLCISRLHCLSLCRLLSGPAARVISSVREDGSRKSRSKSVSGFTGLVLKLASGKPTTSQSARRSSCPLSSGSVVRLAMRLAGAMTAPARLISVPPGHA